MTRNGVNKVQTELPLEYPEISQHILRLRMHSILRYSVNSTDSFSELSTQISAIIMKCRHRNNTIFYAKRQRISDHRIQLAQHTS
jgi:hypothetical protein